MKLWKRDYHILYDLSFNIISLSQIAALYFPSRKKACARMLKLFRNGLVKRYPNPNGDTIGKTEYVYFLVKKGWETLRFYGLECPAPAKKPNIHSCRHSLMINDFRIQIVNAVSGTKLSLDFYYGKQVYLLPGLDANAIEPDAAFMLSREKKRLLHFVEIERGTEALSASKLQYGFEDKIFKYLSYFDSNAYASDFELKGKGFRVLVVVEGREIEKLHKLAVKNDALFFWFGSVEDVDEKSVLDGKIWHAEGRKQSLINQGI